MTKTLCLLRHAQSSRRIDREDFDRPLSHDGFDAAHRMAEIMLTEDLVPDLVLCSAARRASETWDALAAHLDAGALERIAVEAREDLYLAFQTRILMALHEAPEGAGTVLLIGHNPGLQRLAQELSGPGSKQEPVRALARGFPPAALAVYRVAAGWTELSEETARLDRFLLPSAPGPGD